MSQGKKSVADHIRHLLGRIAQLEKNVQSLGDVESRLRRLETESARSSAEANAPPPIDRDVLAQVIELESRLRQVEEENQTLSQTCTQLQEQNEAISNLYVAKHRLHASLDATEIMNIVTEILVELVGAHEFAILFLEQKTKLLKRVSGRGSEIGSGTVALTEGILGRVASSGKPFYYESSDEPRPKGVPLAVIPLKAEGTSVGVIAIYRLLPHKNGFTPVDHQLVELVAEHTPSALLSARLHRLSKAKTKRGA
ncbi:MAG: GAF domain-containing protein [Acidobacteriota bacterium]|nr:MAG: GAF domain-containing protein [Acidobacteriota bacterium]